VRDAMEDADVVVSCAHAKFTRSIVENLPLRPVNLVLMGSAWRYSSVPNKRTDEVRKAEADFMNCAHNGVMLHSTMIYGGNQENNYPKTAWSDPSLPDHSDAGRRPSDRAADSYR
jgi:hypothetical protein